MIQELLYTSAPRGLKPGSRGFCTVMSSRGLSEPLALTLESLSGYRPLFAPSDPRASENPVNWMFLTATVGGKPYWILSRVADYGLDYSQRTNKLAHHLVLDQTDLRGAGPGWVLSQPGVMLQEWQGEPQLLSEIRKLPNGDPPPAPCRAWETLTGDAGWAGVLAECAMSDPVRPAVVIFTPGMDLLALFQEVLSLLPPERRWKSTFSTYFTNLPQSVSCLWRGMIAGSQEANQSRRITNALRIDLTQPLGPAPETQFREQARTGRRPQVPQRKAEPPRQTPVATQTSVDDGFAELPNFVDLPANAPEPSLIPVFTPILHDQGNEYRIIPTAPPVLGRKSKQISEYPVELPERQKQLSPSFFKLPLISFVVLASLIFVGIAGFFCQKYFRIALEFGNKAITAAKSTPEVQGTASKDSQKDNVIATNSEEEEAAKKADEKRKEEEAKLKAEEEAKKVQETAEREAKELAKKADEKRKEEEAKLKAEEEAKKVQETAEREAKELAKKADEKRKAEEFEQQAALEKAKRESIPVVLPESATFFMDVFSRNGYIDNDSLGKDILRFLDGTDEGYSIDLFVPNRVSELLKITRSSNGQSWWNISAQCIGEKKPVICRIEGSFPPNPKTNKPEIRPKLKFVDYDEIKNDQSLTQNELLLLRGFLKLSVIRISREDKDDWIFLSKPTPAEFTLGSDTKKFTDKNTYKCFLKDELFNDYLFDEFSLFKNSKTLPRSVILHQPGGFYLADHILEEIVLSDQQTLKEFTDRSSMTFNVSVDQNANADNKMPPKQQIFSILLPNSKLPGYPPHIQLTLFSEDLSVQKFEASGLLHYQLRSTTDPTLITYAKMMSFKASQKTNK